MTYALASTANGRNAAEKELEQPRKSRLASIGPRSSSGDELSGDAADSVATAAAADAKAVKQHVLLSVPRANARLSPEDDISDVEEAGESTSAAGSGGVAGLVMGERCVSETEETQQDRGKQQQQSASLFGTKPFWGLFSRKVSACSGLGNNGWMLPRQLRIE